MSSTKEIQLEDLAVDSTFFDDLRTGRYILVLGAGFSYGLPNRAGGTIPLVKEFVTLTKNKFNIDISDDNYNDAASEWQEYIEAGNTDEEKASRFNEFKDLFLLDESLFEVKKGLYANILLPKWNHIYTLNFDNVLTSLLEGKNIPYEVQNFQAGSFSPECSLGLGYLHNSMLAANSVKDLIFTTEEYSNKLDDNHLYYAMLNDIKKHGKDIVIIGSRFNEGPVTRFVLNITKGIRPDLKIIHINYGSRPRYGTETEKHFNDRNWINCTTEDFLRFLQENKHKIHDVPLEGAININKGFIEQLLSGEKFSRSKFYSAKQDDNCQWYGVLENFDIIREKYSAIKSEVLHAFDAASLSKVVTVVHGTGGSGKSTLLRRLALEIARETNFLVIWVKDRHLHSFTQNALPVIQADSRYKYLVFIEDWYRHTAIGNEAGKNLLDAAQAIHNIRLVIGDRDIKGKDYLLHLAKPSCLFKLAENENEKIIAEIIAQHPRWKHSSEMILRNPASYNTPLFLILFAIAGISESRIDRGDIDFGDLRNIIRRIAKYDLRKIAEGNTGLAKALHYWSCIYEKNKLFISYDTFLKIADHYNKNEEASNYYQHWGAGNYILDKIKLYINVSSIERIEKKYQVTNLVQFNHDKLSEEVLSKVDFEDWDPYDDIQKLRILDIITEKGDGYSSAWLLDAFLKEESGIFANDQAKRSYIDKLLYKRNILIPGYLNHLIHLGLSAGELYVYLEYLQKKGLYPGVLWLEYFRIAAGKEKQQVTASLLSGKDITRLPYEVITVLFAQPGNGSLKQTAASHILNHKDLFSIPPLILYKAFVKSFKEHEKTVVAKRILTHPELFQLKGILITKALTQPGNEAEKQTAIGRILSLEGLLKLQYSIVKHGLNMVDDTLKRAAAKEILTYKNLLDFSQQIIRWALEFPGCETERRMAVHTILTHAYVPDIDRQVLTAILAYPDYETEKQTLIKRILADKDTIRKNPHLLITVLKQPGNEAEKQLLANTILSQPDLAHLNQPLVSTAFNKLEDNNVKQTAAHTILTDHDLIHLNPQLLGTAFKQPGNETAKQTAANTILTSKDPAKIDPNLLLRIFALPGNEMEKQTAAGNILTKKDFSNQHILFAAFAQPGNEREKQAAASSILKAANHATTNLHLLITAFAQPGNEAEKKNASKAILTHLFFFNLHPSVIKAAFAQPGNEIEKQAAANRIFAHADFLTLPADLLVVACTQPGNEAKKAQAQIRINEWALKQAATEQSSE